MARGGNIAAQNALKREKKEAKRKRNASASLLAAASRSQTSPIDLSEPYANTYFVDIPCTPVAPSPAAAAEQFETPAGTLADESANELPKVADDEAEDQGWPKRVRKSSEIMNVSEFPTNFTRKKEEKVPVSVEGLGNAIYDEKVLVAGIQQVSEGCPRCGEHNRFDFQESVTRGLGGAPKVQMQQHGVQP
jgi:hypothetical protein